MPAERIGDDEQRSPATLAEAARRVAGIQARLRCWAFLGVSSWIRRRRPALHPGLPSRNVARADFLPRL